jgi:hypothetical protein
MTVKELIELLSKLDPELRVRAFDPDENDYASVTGADSDEFFVDLQTDE